MSHSSSTSDSLWSPDDYRNQRFTPLTLELFLKACQEVENQPDSFLPPLRCEVLIWREYYVMKLVDTDTLKAALDKAKAEGIAEITSFVTANRDQLLGLPIEAVRNLIGASGADDTFADMQVALYKAMNPTERAEYERQALVHMRKSREQVTRMMLLLRDAKETLTDIARNALTTLLGGSLA